MFQSTHPHGVRRLQSYCRESWLYGFNPRTRMGCDIYQDFFRRPEWVSIHAPAWGATNVKQNPYLSRAVSIHAPAWGATYNDYIVITSFCEFQSTHPHGVRRNGTVLFQTSEGFNPRTRMGCDLLRFFRLRRRKGFNPRTRMGCDLSEQVIRLNPRTRMGCDLRYCSGVRGVDLFQSTHPHGVRHTKTSIRSRSTRVSIHAPAWGATVYSAMS